MKITQILFALILTLNLDAQKLVFIPDTSISGLIIQDSVSLRLMIPDYKEIIDYVGPGAKLYLVNKDDTEIVTLNFHSGSKADLIAEVIINSFHKAAFKKDKSIKLNIDQFITESGIKLGITKAKLTQIKGQEFTILKNNEKETLKYRISDYATSAFLIRYNYPSYYAHYEFDKNKLINISFGFEYP